MKMNLDKENDSFVQRRESSTDRQEGSFVPKSADETKTQKSETSFIVPMVRYLLNQTRVEHDISSW